MCLSKASLTVYFEPPFWVGLYQREDEDGWRISKITFGGEPRDQEVLDWLLRRWRELRFSPPVPAYRAVARLPSPKRMQREAHRATQPAKTSTKAQQALQLQREQRKIQHKADCKERREAERERKFTLRQEKRRQKHRGH